MQISDLITQPKKINWMELHDLQPENLKVKMHGEKTKQSIVELGFARAIYVWENPEENNKMYIIDGHTRKDILLELVNDGYDIPKELNCTFLDNTKIRTKKEAIVYLARVFNVKTDPINDEVFKDMLENFDLSLNDVKWDDLDMMVGDVEDIDKLDSEINVDNIDTSECKIIFKFDVMMYESVLQRIDTLKQEKNIATNELLLLELLAKYEL